ncbi:hypothetical protein F4780DRAFT_97643 [Xylariomycetidae sp. FL0641]|nr:hypothetical protein F4780DRAFT_97643 [Xylariomycetidae sp. FL0641]
MALGLPTTTTATPNRSHSPPSQFSLFSQLPAELRCKIWELNLPKPRVVAIRCDLTTRPDNHYPNPTEDDDGEVTTTDRRVIFQCTSSASLPINLHVCREARSEALRRYHLLFRPSPGFSGGGGGGGGGVYVDPARDTVYFGSRDGPAGSVAQFGCFVSCVSPADMGAIQHLAVNEMLLRLDDHGSSWRPSAMDEDRLVEELLRKVRARFRGLRRLVFVSRDANPVYSAEATLVEPRMRNKVVERRVADAEARLRRRDRDGPAFALPCPWSVMVLAADPTPVTYDQTVLGYCGKRASFVGYGQELLTMKLHDDIRREAIA